MSDHGYWQVSFSYRGRVEDGLKTLSKRGVDDDLPDKLIDDLRLEALRKNEAIFECGFTAFWVDTPHLGDSEGEICGRDNCPGVIELLPDTSEGGGCSCHANPPCSFCTSTMPECPTCGWRLEE